MPAGAGRTEVVLTTTYRPLLQARAAWRPFERAVAGMLHHHVLDGYAFSDLSAADPQRVFPNVFLLRLSDDGRGACRLVLEIRGRWTATGLPRPLVDAWLRWNTWSMGVAVTRIVLSDAVGRGPGGERVDPPARGSTGP